MLNRIYQSSSGARYVEATLQTYKGQLDTSKSLSNSLMSLVDKGLEIIAAILKASGSVSSGDDNALSSHVAPTDKLISDLHALVVSVNLILQQPGAPATGPATPPTPSAAAASGAAVSVVLYFMNTRLLMKLI